MRATFLGLAILLAACADRPRVVPFTASPQVLSQLTGNWVGQYSSAMTGRSGSIVFSLSGDQKSAHGAVIMYTSVVDVPDDPIGTARKTHAADVLVISFVRAADDVVSGRLDPYPDPGSGAMITTTFSGRMAGDTIEGTYESLSSASNTPVRGTWKVKRRG
jgi:hypothetical protein